MLTGALYILASSLCWSLVFVIPDLLTGFSAVEISLFRFFFFGITSFFLLLAKRRELLQKAYLPIWKKAFIFGFFSSIACYTFTLFCIQYANSATAALLFGAVPIVVALCGNLKKNEFPFKLFIPSLLFMSIGIAISNKEAFVWGGQDVLTYCIGLASGILGVGCWVWYVIASFNFMEKNRDVSSMDWVMMIGCSVLCEVLLLGITAFWMVNDFDRYYCLSVDLQCFLAGTFILGTISSWGALYFWTQGNIRLPITLVGQLAIFELIFGLLLIYLVNRKIPSFLEVTGIFLMITGVFIGLHSLKKIPITRSE